MDVERKEEILEKLEKASSEEYETRWDDKGLPLSKKKSEIKKGKTARKKGATFELKVRKDLEEKGWIVSKWPNNVDLETKKLVPAKKKFNPFLKTMMAVGTGFPDFISFQLVGENLYNIIGVESKVNGLLSKEEKEKCAFLLNQKIFNHIWISKETENGGIEYINFREKYSDKYDRSTTSSKQEEESSQEI